MSRAAAELDHVFVFVTAAAAAWFGVSCWVAGVVGPRTAGRAREED